MPYKDPADQLAAHKRYAVTPKGRAARSRYNTGPKGKAVYTRYKATTRGILATERDYQKRTRGV